jgi:hypothetical protein
MHVQLKLPAEITSGMPFAKSQQLKIKSIAKGYQFVPKITLQGKSANCMPKSRSCFPTLLGEFQI